MACNMLVQPTPAIRTPFRTQLSSQRLTAVPSAVRSRALRLSARAEGKVTREYNEGDGKVSDSKKPLYADEAPPPPQRKLSKEQEQKLRGEYLGLGGSANSPIPNYFLYIILGISFLAVLSWLSGAV
jgi:hypothetical protein